MSTLADVMKEVDRRLDEYREHAASALNEFSEVVAGVAKQHAPVRKAYSTGKAKRKLRAGTRQLTPEEFQDMSQMVAKTSWVDRSGHRHAGYLSPRVAQPGHRAVETQTKARTRHQLPKRGVASWNRVESPRRVLGTVSFKTLKYPTEAVIKVQRMGAPINLSGKKAQTFARTNTQPWKKTKQVAHVQRKPGMVIGNAIFARENHDAPFHISEVQGLGKGLMRHMNAKQRYDVLHGRGVELVMNARGTKAKIVLGGGLKRSIHVEAGATKLSRMVVADVPYAKFVEFGTRYMSAQPFLTPAKIMARRRMAHDIAARMHG